MRDKLVISVFHFFILTQLSFPAYTQELDTANWLKGRIVTLDDDTIIGRVQISREFLQISNPNIFRAYDPSQIRSYTVIDPELGVPRIFARYEDLGVLQPEFYEQLIIGKWHFVRHLSEFYFYVYEPNYFRASGSDDSWIQRKQKTLSGTYYLWDSQSLYKLGPFKKYVKLLATDQWPELSKFAKDRQLSFGKPNDQARIIDYYNKLYSRDHGSNSE